MLAGGRAVSDALLEEVPGHIDADIARSYGDEFQRTVEFLVDMQENAGKCSELLEDGGTLG